VPRAVVTPLAALIYQWQWETFLVCLSRGSVRILAAKCLWCHSLLYILTRDDRQSSFGFPLPLIHMLLIPIPFHSQFKSFPFPWDYHFYWESHSHGQLVISNPDHVLGICHPHLNGVMCLWARGLFLGLYVWKFLAKIFRKFNNNFPRPNEAKKTLNWSVYSARKQITRWVLV